MNPLKKVILGVMIGSAVGLIVAGNEVAIIPMTVGVCIFYSIGLIFGGQLVARWVGKVFNIGTDLTLWLLLVILFRRGFMWGVIIFILVLSITIGIGCYIGVGRAIYDVIKYISGGKEKWQESKYFPFSDADAYLLILGWFSNYNEQEYNSDDISAILSSLPDNNINTNAIDESLSGRRIDHLYRSIDILKKHSIDSSNSTSQAVLLSRLLDMVSRSGKITYQGKEFLYLISEVCGLSKEELEESYYKNTGNKFPSISDSVCANLI